MQIKHLKNSKTKQGKLELKMKHKELLQRESDNNKEASQ